LFVQEYGKGRDTIIVLHGGFGAEHSYLLDAFRGFERDYHLVFYDQRGSLRSPCADSLISVAKHVQDLEQLRVALNLSRANIIAHSMGTYLGLEYIDRYRHHVGAFVLVGAMPPRTSVFTAEDSARSRWQVTAKTEFMERPEIAATIRAAGLDLDTTTMGDQEKTALWRIRYAGANLYHVERWRQIKGGMAFYDPRAGNAASRTMRKEWDFTAVLLNHPCGVTVIHGDHDAAVDFGPVHHVSWTKDAERARLMVIKNAGHYLWLDAPEEFRSALRSALQRGMAC
jgi:pimeloyl-ACP methyl ester carboxylesterase